MMIRSNHGFTLLEITVTLAAVSILMLAMGGALSSTMRAWEQGEDIGMVNASIRVAEMRMSNELTQASFAGDVTVNPVVAPIVVTGNPATAVTFQRPLAVDGSLWTAPITFRLRNEDINGNLLLDAGEDLDLSGSLDRVVERVQDLDGDGVFFGPAELRVIARNIDNLTFALTGQRLDATIAARRLVEGNLIQADNLVFSTTITN